MVRTWVSGAGFSRSMCKRPLLRWASSTSIPSARTKLRWNWRAAARQFQRSFVLADGMEVLEAHLSNGLLHIDLEKPAPETQVRTIPITASP